MTNKTPKLSVVTNNEEKVAQTALLLTIFGYYLSVFGDVPLETNFAFVTEGAKKVITRSVRQERPRREGRSGGRNVVRRGKQETVNLTMIYLLK